MIKPLHDRLILRPSDSVMRGTIFVPDSFKDAATACKVMAKGSMVSDTIRPNDVVLCEIGLGERQANHFPGTRDFWAREQNIYAIIRKGFIYPLGRKILIKRDMADEYHGTVVVPTTKRFQSLTGTIVRIGISRQPMRIQDIKVGDSIRLVEWMEHMTEVELEDGSYGLIVNDTDLLYKTI